MTPGIAYALLIVLTFDAPAPPTPTWHATHDACQTMAAVRVAHYEMTGRPVAYAGCQRVRMDAGR